MDRKTFLKGLLGAALVPSALAACTRGSSTPRASAPAAASAAPPDTFYVHPPVEAFQPLQVSTARWKEVLPADAYRILFEAGTEPRFSSPLLEEQRRGTYICAACYLPLFSSETKFKSGTGWPSFWAPLTEKYIETSRDTSLGMVRTEYHCARCSGHQGHVFMDGPEPTGLRYCNNGLALNFIPEHEALPALRSL
ncbi:peptide-methionine (R)-S-oxide reductase MsrB [Salisaeta longa]|uniref:peptide-methionine (R)-S-oxide reductase MsrB n=1 Tax=Salisaeta longa TaxID=503170 RepID=UPI0003B6E0CF|nr:peptide-methionine (R)-S-oxide reductase MsrB [Salisaeta longa]